MKKRIAQITDTHIDDNTAIDYGADPRRNLSAVLQDIAAQGADEIVFTGDIGHERHGFEYTYSFLFETLKATGLPYHAILGNHDHLEVAQKHYVQKPQGPGGLYYCFEDEACKYIYLDSSAAKLWEEQLKWLEGELKTDKRVIVFIHHPILGFDTGMDRIYPLKGRDRVNAMLQQCKKNVTVFCGHYHMQDKRTDRNITQYITPAVSFRVKKESPTIEIVTDVFGYRIIDIDGETITTHLRTGTGNGFTTETE